MEFLWNSASARLSATRPHAVCNSRHRQRKKRLPIKRLARNTAQVLNQSMSNRPAEKIKVKVRKERDYRPHAEFYHAVWVHLQHVKEQHGGHYYSLLSAFMLSAFTVEAYLNYVGPKVEKGWDDFDKASPLAKLRHVASVLSIKLDDSRQPMQSIIELFSFRNRLAHPRASHVVEEYESTQDDYLEDFYSEPRPKWFAFATEANAHRCYEAVGSLIQTINASLPTPELLPLSGNGWSGFAGSS
jgi:hypothetical protein